MRTRKNPLSQALEKFEKCLETPVVPGELPQWCRRANEACGEVDAHLRREIEETHPQMFRQIQEEDPGLAARVESLREEDEQLLERIEHAKTFLERLTPTAGAVEPDEGRVDEHVQSAVDAGLQLVLAVRKQETAITTWYMESLERDRGTVD